MLRGLSGKGFAHIRPLHCPHCEVFHSARLRLFVFTRRRRRRRICALFLKMSPPDRSFRGFGLLCARQSDSLWQPPDFSVNGFIMTSKWKQAVSLNPVCWFYSSWQCAAVCRLQRHIPLWLWSLRDSGWQRAEHEGFQGWVEFTESARNRE